MRNDKIIEVDFRTKEQKRLDRQNAIMQKWNNFAYFVRDNMDVLAVAVPVVTVVLGGAAKVGSKAIHNHTVNKELKEQACRVYDRGLGKFVYLRRPMKAAEELELEARKANGESIRAILKDMGLLK